MTTTDFGGYDPWNNTPGYGDLPDQPTAPAAQAPAPAPAPKPTGNTDWTAGLTGAKRDAASALITLFEGYGLGDLASDIVRYVRNGESSDTIYLQLQQSDSWKKRFAGNEARKKAGLPVLSPAEYLSVESSYRQTMQQFGLPKGFYDQPSDFAGFIGNDMSPAELQARVQPWFDIAQSSDPAMKAALAQLGISTAGLAAHLLDATRAAPLLQKEVNTIKLARQAQRSKLLVGNGTLAGLTEMGITEDQAAQGFGQIANFLPQTENLAQIYGQAYDQNDAIHEVFGQDSQATRIRKQLASQERAAFSGGGRGTLTTTKGDF